MNRRLPSAALAAACAAVLLASCGGGDQPGGGPGPTTNGTPAPSLTASASNQPSSGPSSPATGSGPSGSDKADSPAVLTIKDFEYMVPKSVEPGAKITITDDDSVAHTVTADKGNAFDVAVDGGGGTASFTAPTKPGSYPFHCTIHPSMHGILVVL